MSDISIVICTYNPDLNILKRCLTAIEKLDLKNVRAECWIVDNNSSTPIIEYDFVRSFLSHCGWANVISELKQGLTAARMKGYQASSAPLIIFFDDDNEPNTDYVQEAIAFADKNPKMGAFGPGIVRVQFTDPVEPWIENYKNYFQEYAIAEDKKAKITEGYPDFYPYGTGMVIKREVLQKYYELYAGHSIRTTDRAGGSLGSCGDLQMVWLGVKNGYEAGRTPLLQLNHLITGSRATRKYINKLIYGTAESYWAARIEIFPEEKEKIKSNYPVRDFTLLKIIVRNFFSFNTAFYLASPLGSIMGYCNLLKQKPSAFAKWLKKLYRF